MSDAHRSKLVVAVALCSFLGIAAFVVMLLVSLKPTDVTLLNQRMEIDVSKIPPGVLANFEWGGLSVFVLHRSPEQVAWIKSLTLPDRNTAADSDLPSPGFSAQSRSLRNEYLVFALPRHKDRYLILPETGTAVFLCERLRYASEPLKVSRELTVPGGFYCDLQLGPGNDFSESHWPWVYDLAGRSVSSDNLPLPIPRHHFEGNILVLDHRG